MTLCPCGSNKNFSHCCGQYISGNALPESPELLMRSRYTAYTLHEVDYIEETMLAPANINFDATEAKRWSQQMNWLKLEVLAASTHGNQGTVEFRAYFSHENKQHVMHEISEFIKQDGRWYYTQGTSPDTIRRKVSDKVSRNDLCPCGSSKKYKKCCGKTA